MEDPIIKDETTLKFPEGFLWGAATSHFQVEGHPVEMKSRLSDWSTWASVAGNIADSTTADAACDFVSRYLDDIELLSGLNLEVKVEPLKPEMSVGPSSVLCLSWTSASHPIFSPERQIALPLRPAGQYEKYRFSVGELKKWIGEGRITGLKVDTNCKPVKLELKSARLVNASDEIPSLWVSPECISHTDSNGTIYTINKLGPLIYDATKIKNAKTVRYEISAPDSWFEHYSGTLRDTGPSEHIADTGILTDLKSSNAKISLDALKSPGFYEFRIMALDAGGKPIGYVSNPINFQLIGTSFKQTKNRK